MKTITPDQNFAPMRYSAKSPAKEEVEARRSAADCSAWRDPLNDPPNLTGRILVWIEGIGPHLVNVSEMSFHFWDGQDDTEMTSPDEWDWWTEIPPPNVTAQLPPLAP